MWTFMVELGEIVEEAQGTDYPNLLFVHGQVPGEAPEKVFELKVAKIILMNLKTAMDAMITIIWTNDDIWN